MVLAIGKFIIVGFAVFWMVKVLSRFKAKEEAKPVTPSTTEVLLMEIRDTLRAK